MKPRRNNAYFDQINTHLCKVVENTVSNLVVCKQKTSHSSELKFYKSQNDIHCLYSDSKVVVSQPLQQQQDGHHGSNLEKLFRSGMPVAGC